MNNHDDSQALQRLRDAVISIYGDPDEPERDIEWLMENIFCDPTECTRVLADAEELRALDTAATTEDAPVVTESPTEPPAESPAEPPTELTPSEFAGVYRRDESWATDLLLTGQLIVDCPGLRISRESCMNFFMSYQPNPNTNEKENSRD